MQDDSSKLSEEMKPSLYLQIHPHNPSTSSHVCSFLDKLIVIIKIRCLLLSYQPPSPFFSTQLVSYSYAIFRKKNKQPLHQNQFYLPDSSMSASSSHSWKARLSSFLFFTHSSSGSVSVSAAGPLYQSPTHHHPPKRRRKKK